MNDDYFKKIFSNNLRYYMDINGKTQVDLINDLHLNKSSISTWVNGTRLPRMDKVDMLAQYFNIKRSNLIEEKVFDSAMKNTNSVTDEEYDHIKKYRNLDDHGKETVDIILDRESKRVIALTDKDKLLADLQSRNSLPVSSASLIELTRPTDQSHLLSYYHSASAGSGVFILGNEVVDQLEVPDSPAARKADYAIKVSGDSMFPDYNDDDIVLVSQKEELNYGDVGIFVINGNAYIKEYGKTELISRNPEAENISIGDYDNIVCMGKVIGKVEED